MTETMSDLLDRAARRACAVVAGVRDDSLDAPTPCAEYQVRDLLDHLYHVVVCFQQLAAKREADFSATPAYVHGEWRAGFRREAGRLVGAWAEPGAEEGTSGSMGLPARTVGGMVLLDLTVHAWDLARATGQDYEPDESVLGEAEDLVAQMGPTGRTMKAFGEPVPVTAGTSRFAKLLAATGRDPAWRPPAA